MTKTPTIEEFETWITGFSVAITYLALASELPPGREWCITETAEQRRDCRNRMVNAYTAQIARNAWLEATVVDHVERIKLFKNAMIDRDFAYAEAMALVFGHEGHIETLNKRIEELEELSRLDGGTIIQLNLDLAKALLR